MEKALLILTIFCSFVISRTTIAQDQPGRTILVIIDGLHYEAPKRMNLPNFSSLADQGTLVKKMTGIIPYHPTQGEYAEVHTSSYPNPMMMTGTIFLKADQPMLQHSIEHSAFVSNSLSYQSITNGYKIVIQKTETDEFAIDQAIHILKNHEIDFLRIHMQNTGSAGSQVLNADSNEPYKYNIWHESSPYTPTAMEADNQIGRLIDELQNIGKWEDTLFILTSDHGQTKTGWHPTLPEESWIFPTVFHGPGIKRNHSIEWADQTDIVPTIAHLMKVELPNDDGGSGRILHNVLNADSNDSAGSSKIFELNKVFARYIIAEAKMLLNSSEYPFLNSQVMDLERDFYGLNRIMDWKNTESIDSLISHNESIVIEMEESLNELNLND
jgi:membrane-anchored protein YejM (alkaline phosphatase superfamily)